MLAVANMEETILFYQNVLGFTPTLQSPQYSIVERDGQTIHFQKAASEEVMNCVRGHTEIYIEVSDIRSLWEHVKPFKTKYKIRQRRMRARAQIQYFLFLRVGSDSAAGS